jgi:hypothetical protein
MRPQVIVKGNPVTQNSAGMLDSFKAITMHALSLDGLDQSFDHPVLLGAMRGNELLLQPIVFDQSRVTARSRDQPIIES